MSYAELNNDEFGEYCIDLCTLAEHSDFLSQNEKFLATLNEEINDNLGYFKNNFRINKRMEKLQN